MKQEGANNDWKEKMLEKILFFCALFGLLQLSTTTDYGQCRTQNNEVSSCIELSECNSLNTLARKADLTAEERLLLKNSQCGYMNKNVLVCCPSHVVNSVLEPVSSTFLTNSKNDNFPLSAADYGSCITPKNEYSFCIELTNCNVLYTMTQKVDLTDDDRIFLRQSQCGYKDKKVLVCCPPKELLPEAPQCGTMLSKRVVGGNITDLEEYPWMALIEFKNLTTNEKGFYCGGTLINNRYVITAAHCVDPLPDFRVSGVRLGEWNLDTNPDCTFDIRGRQYCALPHIDVGIEKVITHPQYDPRSRSQENDIALLRMSETITPNEFVKPICLPLDKSLQASSFIDQEMDIAGWGQTKKTKYSYIKLKATIKVSNFDRCKQKYRSENIFLQSTQMCAVGRNGVDSCRGDSGGPLVSEKIIKNKSTFFLIGIVSFGPNPCGASGWPGVYTRVVDYTDWIKTNIKP